MRIFHLKRSEMMRQILQLRSNVHLTLDCWTSSDRVRSYMAVVAHFVDNNLDYQEHLLDYVDIKGKHTGKNLA